MYGSSLRTSYWSVYESNASNARIYVLTATLEAAPEANDAAAVVWLLWAGGFAKLILAVNFLY